NQRAFHRQHSRWMNVVNRASLLAHGNLPVELTDDVLNAGDRVLVDLITLSLELDRVPLPAERAGDVKDVSGRDRLHIAPVIVASHQPSKTDLRVVEQEFFPVVANTFELDAAHHKADDHLLGAFEL